MTTPTLRTEGLTVQLGGVSVLHDIGLHINPGRWVSVVGPNGAGKSTLLKALAGLIPHAGTVSLDGRSTHALPRRLLAQRLAWMGQYEGAADDLRVSDVVMLGRLPHQHWVSGPSVADHAAVELALRQTQAWQWRERALGQLSAGERQRVLLARALAVQAPILLMDEPVANLDPPHQADWLKLVQTLRNQGTTVVSVLHEIPLALYADEVLILHQGRLLHHGSSNAASTQRALEQVFDHRIGVHHLFNQPIVLFKEHVPQGQR